MFTVRAQTPTATVNGMDIAALTEIEMPPRAASAARTAAIAGTRQLVADETLSAVLALLIAAKVIPAERASAMLTTLSDRLTGHAAGHAEFQVHRTELRLQVDRLRRQAKEIGT